MQRHLILCGLASIALAASASQASVTASPGGGFGPFQTLTTGGLNGGSVATLTDGQVLSGSVPNVATIPYGTSGNFLAAGPSNNGSATLTFTTPVDYFSFLWGSPDSYNLLTVNSGTSDVQTFTASMLVFPVIGGDNTNFSQYVQFAGLSGSQITSVTFGNDPSINAFETSNFSVGSAVPEPATWAMMLIGFGGIGFSMRRRRRNPQQAFATS